MPFQSFNSLLFSDLISFLSHFLHVSLSLSLLLFGIHVKRLHGNVMWHNFCCWRRNWEHNGLFQHHVDAMEVWPVTLQHLVLRHNHLREISFLGPKHPPTHRFPPRIWSQLQDLRLAHNNLTDSVLHVLPHLLHLKRVDLSHNSLKHVQLDQLPPQLHRLDLGYNPIRFLRTTSTKTWPASFRHLRMEHTQSTSLLPLHLPSTLTHLYVPGFGRTKHSFIQFVSVRGV